MFRNTSRRIQDRMKAIADYAALTRVPQKFEACRIQTIAESVVKSLRALAERHYVSLTIDGLHALPLIMGDDARLYSLLYNLVNNAIPEVPPQGSVTIGGSYCAGDGFIEIWVTDTGNGMPADIRDNLFTNRLMSRKTGGTGLGTKIVKEVVEMHGGRIVVHSELGKGTTFHIRLPIDGPAYEPSSEAAVSPASNRAAL
jgi:signal transduction histidine kinase